MLITTPPTILLSLFSITSLISTSLAQTPLTNDPKWAYSGCYTAPAGHILDYFTPANLSTSSNTGTIETCLATCTTRFAALGAGECYCSEQKQLTLPATLKGLPESNCTSPCPSPSSEACGGPLDPATEEPSALSLYDVQPPMYIVDFPKWKYSGCIDHFSALTPLNFTHVATINELTVEGCLNACDHAGLSYTMAALSGGACYCSAAKLDEKVEFVGDGVCSFACPGSVGEACGGSFTSPDPSASLYSRTGGPAPKDNSETVTVTGQLMTRTTSATAATTSTGKGGNGGGNGGGVKTGTGTGSGSKSTSSSAAEAVHGRGEVGGLVGVVLGMVGGVLAVL